MANRYVAVFRTLLHEDSQLAGTVTQDDGGYTRWGISEKNNRDLAPIQTLTLERAIKRAATVYWLAPFDGLRSQDVADFVFDIGFNCGLSIGAQLLSDCVSRLHVPKHVYPPVVTVDLIEAANTCDESALMAAMLALSVKHYQHLVSTDPRRGKFLAGWIARVWDDYRGLAGRADPPADPPQAG